jgi:hypothetical protein
VTEQPGDRGAYLRVAQHYGQILADLRRDQAEIAAEHDAKIAAWQRARQQPEPVAGRPRGAEPEDDDFSTMTWLR